MLHIVYHLGRTTQIKLMPRIIYLGRAYKDYLSHPSIAHGWSMVCPLRNMMARERPKGYPSRRYTYLIHGFTAVLGDGCVKRETDNDGNTGNDDNTVNAANAVNACQPSWVDSCSRTPHKYNTVLGISRCRSRCRNEQPEIADFPNRELPFR